VQAHDLPRRGQPRAIEAGEENELRCGGAGAEAVLVALEGREVAGRHLFFVWLHDASTRHRSPRRRGGCAFGSLTNGTCSIPFLDYAFRTLSYHITVTVNADGTWSYEQDTLRKIAGSDELFHHTDRNTLRRIAAPTPNWLMRQAS
jgi:hypothetical protein